MVRSIDLGSVINARLPFESPQFAGGALFVVVGLPMATAAFAAWRGSRRDDLWAASAGALLMGWIVVEIGVIQSFSWLQPTLFAFGAGIAFAAYRHWHLTWGSNDKEIESQMPGDEIDVAAERERERERERESGHSPRTSSASDQRGSKPRPPSWSSPARSGGR
jgi:hypothetical protein